MSTAFWQVQPFDEKVLTSPACWRVQPFDESSLLTNWRFCCIWLVYTWRVGFWPVSRFQLVKISFSLFERKPKLWHDEGKNSIHLYSSILVTKFIGSSDDAKSFCAGSTDDTKRFCAIGGPASIGNKLIRSSDDTKSFCAVGGPASIRKKLIGSSDDTKSFCAVGGPASIRRVRRSAGPPNVLHRVHRVLRSSERSSNTKSKRFCVLQFFDAIASSADPLGGPYYHFSLLRFAPAIASADPGPPTSGAFISFIISS